MSKTHESTCAVASNARQEWSCESKTPKVDLQVSRWALHGGMSYVNAILFARQLETELNEPVDLLKHCAEWGCSPKVEEFLKKHGRIK